MADIKRLRYWDGQLLNKDDFNLAQDYLMARDSWHGKLFHSPGIADGLTVDAGIGAAQAKVSPGSCMDSRGRSVVLGEEALLPLDKQAGKTALVVISYAEMAVDPPGDKATRWEERPTVELVPEGAGAPPETTHVRLARLVIDAAGKVQQHDASVRRFAGARLGSELDLRKLSLSREGVASSAWPALTCGAAGRVDLNSGSGTLSPGLALSTPGGEDFFSIYGARQGKPTDLLWNRGPLRFGTATSPSGQAFSEKLRITEAGNVGIGNVDPTSYRLAIRQIAPNPGTGLRITNPDANKSLQLWVGTGGGVVDAEGTTDLHLRTNGQDRLFIQNAGNVGIGTTTPKTKLEVAGDLLTRGLTLDNGGPDGARLVWLAQGKPEWRARNNTTLDFFQQEGTPPVLTLAPGGNVGIGAQGPADKLHVAGNIRLDLGKEIFFTDNGQIRSADDNHRILFRRTENKLEIREWGDLIFSPGATGGQETAKVVILANGNVGIGTKVPAAALHVVGTSALAQEAWKPAPLVNGWKNYEGPFNNAAYMKDSLGFVHLRGLVKEGTGPIFTLPEGYRPVRQELFGVSTRENTIGRIDVKADGQVLMVSGSNVWISLDGLTFQAGFTRGVDFGNIDVDRFNTTLFVGPRTGPIGDQLRPVP